MTAKDMLMNSIELTDHVINAYVGDVERDVHHAVAVREESLSLWVLVGER